MEDLHTIADVAARLGVKPSAARAYHQAAQARRRKGEPAKPGDMPPPDRVLSRTPTWTTATLDEWIARRPGPGVGGGRPRKD